MILVACLATIAACSALRPAPVLPSPAEGFVVQGRLAIRTAAEGFSSNFLWEHAADRFAIELWGPLGQGRSRLEGAPGSVTLFTADGARLVEPDTATAVRRWLGVDLPVSALAFWVRGEAAPAAATAHLERGPAGDIVRLEQLAWQLDFSEYAEYAALTESAASRRLPGRIVARHGDVKVTVLPRAWSFAAQSGAPLGAGTP